MMSQQQTEATFQKIQISEVLIRYFAAVDDKHIDMAIVKATFTNDASLIRPNGSATVGHKDILNGHKNSFARFKATHHVITDFIIDVEGSEATLRANLTAMHLWKDNESNSLLNDKHFLAGGKIIATAVKVGNSWRIKELTNHNVWRSGEGMTEMANYERPKN